MKEIYVHKDFTRVGHCRSVLDEAGIPCFIRNENTYHMMAESPIPAFYPALCVPNDGDAERAVELLRSFLAAEAEGATESRAQDWPCPQCAETVPGNFGSCWKCETQRPAPP